MAALLGSGPSLPARLLVEAVPASLVSPRRVKAALGFGSSPYRIQAGRGSPHRAFGTSPRECSADHGENRSTEVDRTGHPRDQPPRPAGVVAVVLMPRPQSATGGRTDPKDSAAASIVPEPQEEGGDFRRDQPPTGQTIRCWADLAAQIDSMPWRRRLDRTAESVWSRESTSPIPGSPRYRIAKEVPRPAPKSIQELEALLKQSTPGARRLYQTPRRKRQCRLVPPRSELYRNKVLIVVGQIEGLDEDLADEIARLKLEMRRKNAERTKAEAAEGGGRSPSPPGTFDSISGNRAWSPRRMWPRRKGELKVAGAQVSIVDAEIAEVGLRIQQLERRQGAGSKQAMAQLANQAKSLPRIRQIDPPMRNLRGTGDTETRRRSGDHGFSKSLCHPW